MAYPDKIDLHMHTVISDGTDEPVNLIPLISQAEIGIFSVTDHDAVEGCRKIRALLESLNENAASALPRFINGVEFSCKDELGKYHILGYGYPLNGSSVNAIVREAHALRMEKLEKRLAFLKENFSVEFPPEEVQELRSLSNPGKPHIAKLMIRHGLADSISDAMKNYLNKKKFQNAYIRPEQAIEAILSDGGIPVLAHPSFGDGDQLITGDEMDARLRRLLNYGLQGAECFYSGFTPKLEREMLDYADQFDLYVTAGSDYHGANKLVQLGDTNYDPSSDGRERVWKFLDAVLPDL